MSQSASIESGARLLAALEHTGPQPALAWYGEAARIELSGHVLANWVIKAIGHLEGEVALEPADDVVLELPPHWKRLVLALATWSLGGTVHVSPGSSLPPSPRIVATDHPDSGLAGAADEVLALDAVSLTPSFGGGLPPLAHDWAAEVRAFSDQLDVALPAWSGPQPSGASSGAPAVPRLLVTGDGLGSMPAVLAAWLAGGGIVGPADAVGADRARDEGVTGPA